MFVYRAFELTIGSELELSELPAGEGPADVDIRLGEVPRFLPDAGVTGVRYQATSTQFLLHVDGHARYLVKSGREVVIEPMAGASRDAVRLFFFGPVLGAVLRQRGVLALRGSVVEIRGAAAIFAGPSGVGKSSLACALAQRGHRILSDAIAAISVRGGRPFVTPGPAAITIWADMVEKLGLRIDELARARPGLEKYVVRLGNSYCSTALPVSNVYVLSTSNAEKLKIVPLKGMEKLSAVTAQTVRPRLPDDKLSIARQFDQCSAVSQSARVCRLVSPELSFSPGAIAETVEEGCSS